MDLDAFERYNKAEGLGVTEGAAQAKNLHDTEHTCRLFRFLQLLCEGHNLGLYGFPSICLLKRKEAISYGIDVLVKVENTPETWAYLERFSEFIPSEI